VRPSGVEFNRRHRRNLDESVYRSRIVTINAPSLERGQLLVTGSGDLSASINGEQALFNCQVRLRHIARPTGTRGPSSRSMVNRCWWIRSWGAQGCWAFSTIRFEALSPAGVGLRPEPLVSGNPSLSRRIRRQRRSTDEPFRVYARGTDANDSSSFAPSGDPRHADCPSTTVCSRGPTPLGATLRSTQVTNWSADSFLVTAADDAAFVSGVAPSTLSLGPGASGVTAVNLMFLRVPPVVRYSHSGGSQCDEPIVATAHGSG